MNKQLIKDAARAVRNNRHEVDGARIFVPGVNMFFGGIMSASYAPPGGEFGPRHIAPNRVVLEGRNLILNLLRGASAPALFLAPFSGDVEPADNWTGANFSANATEIVAYTSATRVPWTTVAATTAQLTNAAALAAAQITFNAGGPYIVRGLALLGSNAKGGGAGPLIVAARLDDDLTGMVGGGKLQLQYDLNALDEADA
ncbi:MAG: hypothetical protein ACREO0_04640 [Pseudoxanthomonas sp.]